VRPAAKGKDPLTHSFGWLMMADTETNLAVMTMGTALPFNNTGLVTPLARALERRCIEQRDAAHHTRIGDAAIDLDVFSIITTPRIPA